MSDSGVRKRAKVEIDHDVFSREWDDAMIAYNQQLRMMEEEDSGPVSDILCSLKKAVDEFRAGGVMAGVIQTCIRTIRDASERNRAAITELAAPTRETVARAALIRYTEGLAEAREFVQKLVPAIPSQEDCDRHADAASAANKTVSASFLRALPITLRRFLGEKSVISVTSRPIQEELRLIRPIPIMHEPVVEWLTVEDDPNEMKRVSNPVIVEKKGGVPSPIPLIQTTSEVIKGTPRPTSEVIKGTPRPKKPEMKMAIIPSDPTTNARRVTCKNFCSALLDKLRASFPWRVYFQVSANKKKSGISAEWAIITDAVPILDPAPMVYFVFQIPAKPHTMFFNEFCEAFGKLHPQHKSMMTLKRLLVARAGNDAVFFEQVVPDNVLQFMDSTAVTIFLDKDLSPYTNTVLVNNSVPSSSSLLVQTTNGST